MDDSEVIKAGNMALIIIDDLKEEALVDDTKAKEYQAEVVKAKLVMGKPLWQLMLITMEGDKKEQPVTQLKSELNIKYHWERELSESRLDQKKMPGHFAQQLKLKKIIGGKLK